MLKNFKTYQLSLKLYKECKTVPLPGYLKDQILRASSSIVLNLAEGSARRTSKDRRRFYNIALASTREVQAVIDLEIQNEDLRKLADHLGGGIYRLCERA